MAICPKVNVIVRLEIELAYYDVVVQLINHLTTGTSSLKFLILAYSFYFIHLFSFKFIQKISLPLTSMYRILKWLREKKNCTLFKTLDLILLIRISAGLVTFVSEDREALLQEILQ